MLTPEEQRRRAQENAAREASAQADRDRQAARLRALNEAARQAAITTTPEYLAARADAAREAERKLSEATSDTTYVTVAKDIPTYGGTREVMREAADDLAKTYQQQGYSARGTETSRETGEHGRPGNHGSPDTRKYWTTIEVRISTEEDR